MADTPLRLGIVGAGTAGGRHAAALRKIPGVTITAIAEPDQIRGSQLASDLGARHFYATDGAFWNAIDAVIICAPHALLAAIARDALDHGKPSLVEKPLALSLADIDDIQRAADQTGLPVMIGFVHRHRADAIAARHAIDSGALGEPAFAVEHLISGGGPTPGWVWSKSMAGGGVTLYNGVHGIDRQRWLLGREVTHVFAQTATRSRPADVEDITVATLIFEGGISVSFVQHIAPYPLPSGWRSEIYGTQGAVLFGADGTLTISTRHTTTAMKPDRDDRFLTQGIEFVSAIRAGRSPSVTIADGRAALQIAHGIYRSAETNSVIALSDIVA
jgi:predicted dehydrogenase